MLEQLRQLTGRGSTEIVRDALELELQRQRCLSRRWRLTAVVCLNRCGRC